MASSPFDRYAASDRQAVLTWRDEESRRWLGPGSDDPAPMGCIEVDSTVVGWIDVDAHHPWLQPGEANVGYCVFPAHRGRGYAARAVRLLPAAMDDRGLRWALLVIDVGNVASMGVARSSGARLRPERTWRGSDLRRVRHRAHVTHQRVTTGFATLRSRNSSCSGRMPNTEATPVGGGEG